MKDFGNKIKSKGGAVRCDLNMDRSENQVESFSVEQAQPQVKSVDSQETQKQREEKLDLWMKNIKEFIRNIDIESL